MASRRLSHQLEAWNLDFVTFPIGSLCARTRDDCHQNRLFQRDVICRALVNCSSSFRALCPLLAAIKPGRILAARSRTELSNLGKFSCQLSFIFLVDLGLKFNAELIRAQGTIKLKGIHAKFLLSLEDKVEFSKPARQNL